jgi:hypothetical protein
MKAARKHYIGSVLRSTAHRRTKEFSMPENQDRTSSFRRSIATITSTNQVWSDIAIDFIKGFPMMGGKSVILTVVDRFSKYAHFISLSHPYSFGKFSC